MNELNREETNKKLMLYLFRKAVSAVSKMKLITVEVSLDYRFGESQLANQFDITVFKANNGSNATFYFYNFTSFSRNEQNLEHVISVIKKDNFEEIRNTEIHH